MHTPKVFISYSHDTPIYKNWIIEIATRLRSNGIDAIIDVWDLKFGEDLPRFMEENILLADRVLMFCSENYVEKANSMKGGVGYEKMIVTSEMIKDLGTTKFVPVMVKSNKEKALPRFMGNRLYADFSNQNFDSEFKNLVDEILGIDKIKPLLKIKSQTTSIVSQIIPFEHVDGIKPGLTKYSDIIKLFGRPDDSIISEKGSKLIKYLDKGISLIVDKGWENIDPIIDSVIVYPPYSGKSPNGLYIGINKEKALEIVDNDYVKTYPSDKIFLYGITEIDRKSDFQIWFDAGKLSKMKIFK
ncbi:toll/interleukin-1 receptor domain-containing protein [uncultured Christiangramia sp.]|uniref:toll/interleukin-1 receptor domain-containing protein n=1 Tax=Christiangramia sp. 3-2217-3z TaxID=3417564 RepID=UPI00262506DA|nr:toll/interleukin-1 receptor domain-containing protein [uncultured Christiangramia sp.]